MRVVKKEISIEAPREAVWRHLEDPDLLAGWLMRNDFEPEVGRAFRFYARPSRDWDGVLHCRLVEFDPPSRMAFTWNANDIGTETRVTIELTEEAGTTRLRLTHEGFEGAAYDVDAIVARHEAGWADYVDVLRSQIAEERGGKREVPPVDWTTFDLHVAIDASPERVLASWTTIEGMESFFVELMRITGPEGAEREPDESARPGDRYVWRWHDGRRVMGEYLTPDGDDEARFTFGESKVSVRARPYRDGTLLRLRQYDIPDTEEARMHVHANCRGGWVYFLTVLKALLEEGVDPRDTSRETGASFSTYFDPARIGVEF